MFYLYFLLIPLSLIGYGLASNKLLKIDIYEIGLLGILGLISISIISYLSSFFFIHDYYFNFITLLIGLVFFFYNFNLINNFKF